MTGPLDIEAEFDRAIERTNRTHYDRLINRGVASRTLYVNPVMFGVERIEVFEDGTYQPAPSGKPAIVQPVCPYYEIGDLCPHDLVAWHQDDPNKWWLRLGIATLINDEAVETARHLDRPLEVHETPLDWLRGGAEGVVILDWSCHLPLWLGGANRIVAPNSDLAERIDQAFQAPHQIPEIRIREVRDAA